MEEARFLLALTIAVIQGAFELNCPVLLNGVEMQVVEVSPLCAVGIPQFRNEEGKIICVKRSDDLRIKPDQPA